ncbi:MAG: T9SS type A sorting domain-containing protein [Flavobacteriales bacterium]|nr:T9SS type A sorting domain-containing protein [Flavobacteriales bacterium]
MKRPLLILLALGCLQMCNAQVIFDVQAPASIAGTVDFTNNGDGSNWGLANLLDPADAILDTLMLAEDGTPGINPQGIDSTYECCGDSIINDLSGKIAVIYRNTCAFGTKALNAQDAGAVGVVIINREPGLVNMDGTAGIGSLVNIPVTFIDAASGAAIRAAIDNGDDVVAFIGNKTGFYGDDIGLADGDVLRAEFASTPRHVAQSATDFSVDMGAQFYNYGTNDQTDIVLTATIEFDGATIYTESSASTAVNSGDTAFIALPTFSQPSYGVGYYTVSYILTMGATDEYIADNIVNADFQISDNLLSLGQLDTNMVPESGVYYRATNTGANIDFTSCVIYRDSVASRMNAEGMWFAASGGLGDSLTGTYVQLFVYEWTDVFTDLNDPAYNNASLLLNQVASGEYDYLSDLQNEFVYAPITSTLGGPLNLTDNSRYLFCVAINTENVYISHDTDADYTLNRNYYLQPLSAVQADLSWNANGFGATPQPSTAIKFSGVTAIEESYRPEFMAYPNPAGNMVTFRLGNNVNLTHINVLDITGNLVKSRAISNNGAGSIALDVSNLANGQYIFALTEKDGRTSNIKVTIAR